jgi:hypothetical protein
VGESAWQQQQDVELAYPRTVQILLWLVPSGVMLVVMMLWASWAGRPRRDERDRSEAAYDRFAKAITKEHPGAGRPRPVVARDRSTGIAVRPSRTRQGGADRTRRSA